MKIVVDLKDYTLSSDEQMELGQSIMHTVYWSTDIAADVKFFDNQKVDIKEL